MGARAPEPEKVLQPTGAIRGNQGHLMLKERIAPQSEVIRAILLEDSPCCGGPAPGREQLGPLGQQVGLGLPEARHLQGAHIPRHTPRRSGPCHAQGAHFTSTRGDQGRRVGGQSTLWGVGRTLPGNSRLETDTSPAESPPPPNTCQPTAAVGTLHMDCSCKLTCVPPAPPLAAFSGAPTCTRHIPALICVLGHICRLPEHSDLGMPYSTEEGRRADT